MENLERLAKLLQDYNRIEAEIANIIGRPGIVGHIGEYIGTSVFSIKPEDSKTTRGYDGIFSRGILKGKTVNIKYYPKRESYIDWKDDALPDFFLILAGPKRRSPSSSGKNRPLVIEGVYIFETKKLRKKLISKKVQISKKGERQVQASVKNQYWEEAEIYPKQRTRIITLSQKQKYLLGLFSKVT